MEKETELAKYVIEYLNSQHWEVYQEVEFKYQSGVADIVAVRNNIMWIIECKLAYTLSVLEQATRWPAHYRSIAIPSSRNTRNYRVAVDYYHVGVIEVIDNYPGSSIFAKEVILPKLFIHNNPTVKKYLKQLTELHKTYAQAGSNKGDHLTPYKQTMIALRAFISAHPGCTINEIYKHLGKMHYSSVASFKGSVLTALYEFEPWCRIDTSSKPYKLFIKESL